MQALTRGLVGVVFALGACGGDSSVAMDAAMIDAPPMKDPCALCGKAELCVQRFDGVCTLTTECVPTTDRCTPGTCSAECEQTHCPRPYQCTNRAPCGTESPAAFTCYGP